MYCVEDTWDAALSKELREDSIKLLEEYADLSLLRFTRALTPPDPVGRPCAITFSDGSEHAYCAVLYLRWSCSHGVIMRLVESKAKLTPLDQKGDPVKAEMCGAVFAARLKNYFQKHCRIDVERWYHLVDSQTILGAIQRESYGYQTFFANRVGEIQSTTDVRDWWWIPGPANIADIITRGARPDDLTEESKWQSGPEFLQLPESEWQRKMLLHKQETISPKYRKKPLLRYLPEANIKRMIQSGSRRRNPSPEDHRLLLGRATRSGDFKAFDYSTYPFKRLQEMQTQVSHFWKSWSQLAGPNLFIRSKWHTAERNVAIGDIVWLCDQNALRGQFKLARVVSVNADPRGIVRDVLSEWVCSGEDSKTCCQRVWV